MASTPDEQPRLRPARPRRGRGAQSGAGSPPTPDLADVLAGHMADLHRVLDTVVARLEALEAKVDDLAARIANQDPATSRRWRRRENRSDG